MLAIDRQPSIITMKIWLLILGFASAQIPYLSQAQITEKHSSREAKSVHERNLAVLEYIKMGQSNYGIMYVAKLDAERFQFKRIGSLLDVKLNYILKIGEISPDKMFRVDGHKGADIDITYLPDGRKFKLKPKLGKYIPSYHAIFRQTTGAGGEKKEIFYVSKSKTFTLAINPKLEYSLVDINSTRALISFQPDPGKEKKVELEIKK